MSSTDTRPPRRPLTVPMVRDRKVRDGAEPPERDAPSEAARTTHAESGDRVSVRVVVRNTGWMPVPSTCGRTTARTRGWRSWDGPPSPLPGAAWWPEAASRPTSNRGGGDSCLGAPR